MARAPVPAGRDVGRRRHQLRAVLRARQRRRAVPVRRRGQRDPDPDDAAHRAQLALLPPRHRTGPALRLPRAGSVRAARGPPVQPVQAAARPVREVDRRRRRLGPRRERASVRTDRGGGRRPRARRRGRRRGDAQVGRDRRRVHLGGRSPAAGSVRRHRHLRDPRQGLHDAPPRRPRGPPGHVRGARLRAGDRVPAPPRGDRRRAPARPPHLRRVVPGREGTYQLLGLQHDRLPRATLRVRRHRAPRGAGPRVQGDGQGAASRRHRGDPRRGLQPHRRGQPPRPDAVVQGRRQPRLLPGHARRPPALHGLHRAPATRSTPSIRAFCA